MGVIFIAGSYGVGKSTLCSQLSSSINIPCYSAGDVISAVTGEAYGANKATSNKSTNQDILADEITKILAIYPRIILAGHFCIFDKFNQVEILPEEIFSNLKVECILLLEAETERIIRNLGERDGKKYTNYEISTLAFKEKQYAQLISKKLSLPIIIHKMNFDGTDAEICLNLLKEKLENESFVGY